MGIRAVQAGALTAAIDRPLPEDHAETRDYARAAFRRLRRAWREPGGDRAPLCAVARFDTLVLGVKNRQELAECVAAAEAGPLPRELVARIDASMEHTRTA